MTQAKKTKPTAPDAQALNALRSRYFSWLVQRETKRLQGRRVHWIGKKVASTQA